MDIPKKSHTFQSGQQLELHQGDITVVNADAIVNAANAYLEHGGGVAEAISLYGGPSIQKESYEWVRQHGLVTHDKPAYTTAGNLDFKYVIHAVGPLGNEENGDEKLKIAVFCSLEMAASLNLSSIAFPAISTGIFGFPKDRAARIFMRTINDFFLKYPDTKIDTVMIVLYDDLSFKIFSAAFEDFYKQELS